MLSLFFTYHASTAVYITYLPAAIPTRRVNNVVDFIFKYPKSLAITFAWPFP